MKQFKKELEETLVKIENYLENFETQPEKYPFVEKLKNNTMEDFEDGYSSYLQQRAKLTAYLYVLENLDPGNKVTSIISERRGITLIDEQRGIVKDTHAYLTFKETEKKADRIFLKIIIIVPLVYALIIALAHYLTKNNAH